MAEDARSIERILLRGRARPQREEFGKDDFLHWLMEVPKPYPHVVHFGIVPSRCDGPVPFLHDVECAEEVLIEFDLTCRVDNFDGIFPALETSLDRMTITKPSLMDGD